MAERSDTEESLDMAQCKRLQDAFFLRQPSHMASLAQSQNQSCKTITMLGEMCGQLELEWLHCHSENWASQMARRDPDRNSTAGRWTLPTSTFAGLTRLPSTRVTSGCWSTFVLCALYLSVSLMTLFLPSGKTTCVSPHQSPVHPNHPSCAFIASPPARSEESGVPPSSSYPLQFCLRDIHSSQSFLFSSYFPSASFPWPLLPLWEDPLGVLGSQHTVQHRRSPQIALPRAWDTRPCRLRPSKS